MSIRRPAISRKFGKRRYALFVDNPIGYLEAKHQARLLQDKGFNARVVRLKTGWFVYHYPQ